MLLNSSAISWVIFFAHHLQSGSCSNALFDFTKFFFFLFMYYLYMLVQNTIQNWKRALSLTCMHLFKINANTREFLCIIMCYVRLWTEIMLLFFFLLLFWYIFWMVTVDLCAARIPFFCQFGYLFFFHFSSLITF